jgi:hypothetical protein
VDSGTLHTVSLSVSESLSVSSVSHPLKRVLRELNRKHLLVEQLGSSVAAQRLVVATKITVCLVVTMETLVSVV